MLAASRSIDLKIEPLPPFIAIDRHAVGALIQSLTVGNRTSGTTVIAHAGLSPFGPVLQRFPPGAAETYPIPPVDGVCFTFESLYPDGTLYVTASRHALSASGFQIQVAAPAFLWDIATWDATLWS